MERIAGSQRANTEEHRELSSQIGKQWQALAKQAEALAHLREDDATQRDALAKPSETLAHLREDAATQGEKPS